MTLLPELELKITPLIETLWIGKIADADYFSKQYKNYISNSRLSLIDPSKDGSPEKFFAGFKPIYSSSLELGSAVHEIALQSDLFTICDSVDKPTGKVGIIADKLYSKYKAQTVTYDDVVEVAKEIDYYRGNATENQLKIVYSKCIDYWRDREQFEGLYNGDKEIIYLDPKTREIAHNCLTAIFSNQYMTKLLKPESDLGEVIFKNEDAILLDVEVEIPQLEKKFILSLKSKLDNYSIDTLSNTIVINDIKTLGKIVSKFNENIENYSYNRELAMYSWLLSLVVKKFYNMENPTIKGNYLVVSTIPSYYTKIVPMTSKMYKEGWDSFTSLLKLVAYYVATEYKDFGRWI